LQRALAEASDVVLDQIVYANWSRETALTKSRWLVRRHPDARLVWAGSDQMAFGAMQAWREHAEQPGRDVLFSGVNTSTEALKAVRSGELSALAGGHFMAGAWALVMIHDYAKGRDFAPSVGLELVVPMFILFTPPLAEHFMQRFGDDSRALDFRRYSLVLNPRLPQYDFDVSDLLR
jgi:ABC-type sugar transport system substrate-binding protein